MSLKRGQKLLALVQVKATVLRDGQAQDIPTDAVVPGDIMLLSAEQNIPGDCLVLESNDCALGEAALTGETNLIVTKGALKNILAVCSTVETAEGKTIEIADQRQKLHSQAENSGSKGFRALGVTYREWKQDAFTKDDETASTAVFLASDAAIGMTGHVVTVCAGAFVDPLGLAEKTRKTYCI